MSRPVRVSNRFRHRLWTRCCGIRDRHAEKTRTLLFGLVGLSGMAIDLSMLYLLLSITGFSIARAASILVAMTWNFALNRAITFRSESQDSIFQQYWRFVVSCSLGATVNWSVSLILSQYVAVFEQHALLSATAGILSGFLLNFQLCRRWVFRKADHRTVAESIS